MFDKGCFSIGKIVVYFYIVVEDKGVIFWGIVIGIVCWIVGGFISVGSYLDFGYVIGIVNGGL